MADERTEPADIKETDIVFECPHCSKSLCIDYRGAGLFITCPDCSNRIQVPIPDGMEISDLDSSSEEQEARIIHMREALSAAKTRVRELEAEVADLQDRRQKLEKLRTDSTRRTEELAHEVAGLERGLAHIMEVLKRSAEAADKLK